MVNALCAVVLFIRNSNTVKAPTKDPFREVPSISRPHFLLRHFCCYFHVIVLTKALRFFSTPHFCGHYCLCFQMYTCKRAAHTSLVLFPYQFVFEHYCLCFHIHVNDQLTKALPSFHTTGLWRLLSLFSKTCKRSANLRSLHTTFLRTLTSLFPYTCKQSAHQSSAIFPYHFFVNTTFSVSIHMKTTSSPKPYTLLYVYFLIKSSVSFSIWM